MIEDSNNLSTSYITVERKAIANNIKFIRKLIKREVKLCAVVKGNAYGHGIEQFVPLLEATGVHTFGVFSSREAYRVQQVAAPDRHIMIMGWIEDQHLTWAVDSGISFYVFEFERLHAAITAAKATGKKALVHIEVETGMNRTGFEENTIPEVMMLLQENKEWLTFQGLCTHYAGAESITNYIRVTDQIKRYKEIKEQFKESGLVPKLHHTACSAATLAYPETHMDMVRIGILLYGFWPNQETYIYHLRNQMNGGRNVDPLKRVMSWKTQIMSVKKVEVGEFIGYGTSYQAPKNMTIATVPVGYSYGFTRSLSNLGRVLIHGKRTAVIGVVNMNLMIIDISHLRGVKKGDEVVLIGYQKKRSITVASFGELSNQLNYELLSRLPVDLPRVIV